MPVAETCERIAIDACQKCLLTPKQRVLVGVSGGADSLCLLSSLYDLGYSLGVAHFDHGIRHTASQDAEVVRSLADSLGLPFFLGKGDVFALAKHEKRSLEEAARISRYRYLFETARQAGFRAVAVGHTADDQVETVLMHFLRGAATSGLRGMVYRALPSEWDTQIPLVRPLLGIWRKETIEFCLEKGFKPVWDETNEDTTYHRNRIRLELIPLLEQINPQFKKITWRMAQVMEGDHQVLEGELDRAWQSACIEETPGKFGFLIHELQNEPIGIQRGILRRAANRLRPGLRDVGFDPIERGIAFLHQPVSTGKIDWIQGIRLLVHGDVFSMIDLLIPIPLTTPQVNSELRLKIPGTTQIENGWDIEAELLENAGIFLNLPELAGADDAYLDLSQTGTNLLVRPVQPGDRFFPLGLGGHRVKVTDFFASKHLPAEERKHYPLIWSGDRIAWIPGFAPADWAKLTACSKAVLHLRLVRHPG